MHYDKIKDRMAVYLSLFPPLRKLFYAALYLLFLREWYIIAKVKKYFRNYRNLRFYDAGAGFGQYSHFILHHWPDAKVLAVDLKTDYMDSFAHYAESQGWKNFTCRQADLQDYTPKRKFDLILAIDILEHIENDQQVLNHFATVLDEGGKLIISSPSNLDQSAEFTEEHVRFGYSREDITTKLQTAGLRVVSFEYSYGFWGQLYWKLTLKYPMTFLRHGFYLLPLLIPYYLITYPMCHLFMQMDLHLPNPSGTGVIIVAERS